jgi:hypothetical protein
MLLLSLPPASSQSLRDMHLSVLQDGIALIKIKVDEKNVF